MKKFYDRQREMAELRELQHQAETLEGEVEVYEVKRNPQKYSPSRLDEKVTEMKRCLFRGKEITKAGLSMDDM